MTNTMIGYARVSTDDQSVGMQIDALKKAGVLEENIFHESMSGTKRDRPALKEALRNLREGDTFVVWKFDRVARSISHLLEIIEVLDEKKAKFVSTTEGIDTSTTIGRSFLMMIGVFAQLERDLIAERTQAGVDRARANGVKFGADFKLDPKEIPKLWKLVNEQGKRKVDMAKKYDVSVQTITRRLKEYESEQQVKEKS